MVIEAGALGDRYTLTERIAVGGMGAVYRATDNRLGRTVALKLLKEGLAHDPRFVERFRREARSAAGLTHPNIAGVFDYGEEGGRHFIVMELADGRDLSRLLVDDGPLAPERALKIAAAIADALGHAHRMGVVHRDVKPANVIVDAHDKVKVTDFGIARAAGDS
ncbi:MAG: protein kinase domain-containing protein, partial [Actinomycetota bacterium]